MKIEKISTEELIQLVYNQIDSKLIEERHEYEIIVKDLYKLCKKPILKKAKERFDKCLIMIKKLLMRMKK